MRDLAPSGRLRTNSERVTARVLAEEKLERRKSTTCGHCKAKGHNRTSCPLYKASQAQDILRASQSQGENPRNNSYRNLATPHFESNIPTLAQPSAPGPFHRHAPVYVPTLPPPPRPPYFSGGDFPTQYFDEYYRSTALSSIAPPSQSRSYPPQHNNSTKGPYETRHFERTF